MDLERSRILAIAIAIIGGACGVGAVWGHRRDRTDGEKAVEAQRRLVLEEEKEQALLERLIQERNMIQDAYAARLGSIPEEDDAAEEDAGDAGGARPPSPPNLAQATASRKADAAARARQEREQRAVADALQRQVRDEQRSCDVLQFNSLFFCRSDAALDAPAPDAPPLRLLCCDEEAARPPPPPLPPAEEEKEASPLLDDDDDVERAGTRDRFSMRQSEDALRLSMQQVEQFDVWDSVLSTVFDNHSLLSTFTVYSADFPRPARFLELFFTLVLTMAAIAFETGWHHGRGVLRMGLPPRSPRPSKRDDR